MDTKTLKLTSEQFSLISTITDQITDPQTDNGKLINARAKMIKKLLQREFSKLNKNQK